MGRKAIDITGQRFGRLTVIERVKNTSRKDSLWLCKCECGNIKEVTYSNLNSGHTKSCGCFRIETTSKRNTKTKIKHHLCSDPIYEKWTFMKSRCYYTNNDSYTDYGGRGIVVCDEWIDTENGFINFYNWSINNGWAKDLTLDRIDNNGKYCPENCRWATLKEQANNKRNTVYLEYNDIKLSLSEWAEKLDVPRYILKERRSLGWSDDKIITTPIQHRRR